MKEGKKETKIQTTQPIKSSFNAENRFDEIIKLVEALNRLGIRLSINIEVKHNL